MSETDKLVTYGREGHIGTIALNTPKKRNAFNPTTWAALDEVLAEAEKDREARVILVTGQGKSFCAGLDLSLENELIALVGGEANAAQKVEFYNEVLRAQAVHTRLERLPQPTIAVIQGHCLGAGLELAVCCDLRIAVEGTLFSLPEAKLGFITDVGGLQRLPRIVGPGYAREIAYRAHQFDTARAARMGLLNDVLPDYDSALAEAMKIAAEIAANAPLAVQGAKDVFLYAERHGLKESLEYNAARSSMIVPSKDMTEAFTAFMEKRPGNFKGA